MEALKRKQFDKRRRFKDLITGVILLERLSPNKV